MHIGGVMMANTRLGSFTQLKHYHLRKNTVAMRYKFRYRKEKYIIYFLIYFNLESLRTYESTTIWMFV